MRRASLTLAMAMGVSLASVSAPAGAGDRLPLIRAEMARADGDVLVVAHRGCWQDAPENSLAAIRACIALGVDMVEIDVRRTADGQLVLMHDENVSRTTNGQGLVSALPLDHLKTLTLREGKGGDGAPLTDQRIPTLREALVAAKGRIMLNIDAKQDLHDQIFAEVDATGTRDQILMKMRAAPNDPALSQASFHGRALFMPVIVECGHALPERGKYCAQSLAALVPEYDRYKPVAFEVVYTSPTFLAEGLAAMRQRGRLWVNTLKPQFAAGLTDDKALNDPDAIWGALVRQGVNIIQTDAPQALLTYLRQAGRRERLDSGPGGQPSENGGKS